MARIISGKFGGYDEKSRPIGLDADTTAAIEILLEQLIKTDDGCLVFSLDCGEKFGEKRKEMRMIKKNGHFFFDPIHIY